MRHLDEDYESGIAHPKGSLLAHLHDTIRILGGIPGLLLIGVGAALFYGFILYTIKTGRAKRLRKRA